MNETNKREESVWFVLVKDLLIQTESVENDPSVVQTLALIPVNTTRYNMINHQQVFHCRHHLNVVFSGMISSPLNPFVSVKVYQGLNQRWKVTNYITRVTVIE